MSNKVHFTQREKRVERRIMKAVVGKYWRHKSKGKDGCTYVWSFPRKANPVLARLAEAIPPVLSARKDEVIVEDRKLTVRVAAH